ncbi:MAG: DUF4157 domain-containing protein [Rhodanobacter sp.]
MSDKGKERGRSERENLQHHVVGTGSGKVGSGVVQDVLLSSGQPLDAATRVSSHPRFENDFSQVPVSLNGPTQSELNQTVKPPVGNDSAAGLRADIAPSARAASKQGHLSDGSIGPRRRVQSSLAPLQRALDFSPGERLPSSLSAIFSGKFRRDLSQVTLHRDAEAAAAVRSIGANAFARGNKLFFREGAFQPGSPAGQALLAHELAHVVQQTSGSVGRSVRFPGNEEFAQRASRLHLEGSAFLDAGPPAPVSIAADTGLTYEDEEAKASVRATDDQAADRSLDIKAEADARRSAAGGTDASTGRLDEQALQIESSVKASIARKAKSKHGHAAAPSINASPDLRGASAEEIQAHNRALLKAQMLSPDKREKLRLGRDLENTQRAADARAAADTAERKSDTASVVQRINRLRTDIDGLEQGVYESNELRKSTSSWVTGPVHAYGGAWQELEPTDFQDAYVYIGQANEAVARGNLTYAEYLLNQSAEEYVGLSRKFKKYGEGIQRGGGRVVSGLKVVKATGAVAATVATGGAGTLAVVGVGAGYAGVQNIAGQASEVHFGLRDKIDWGDVAFDTVSGALSGYLGGKLGNLVVGRLMANPAVASLGRKAITYAVADYIAGRAGSTMDLTLHAAYNKARGRDVTWEQFLDQFAGQFTDPTQAATAIIMGHATRYAAKVIEQGGSRDSGNPPPVGGANVTAKDSGDSSGGDGGGQEPPGDGGGGFAAGRQTIRSSPPPMPNDLTVIAKPSGTPTIRSSPPPPPGAGGPQPATDVDMVKANIASPGSVRPQAPDSHQTDWTQRGGSGTAPLVYRVGERDVRVRADHPLVAPLSKGGIPPVSPLAQAHVATPGSNEFTPKLVSPLPSAGDIGLEKTGQAPALSPDPMAKTFAAPANPQAKAPGVPAPLVGNPAAPIVSPHAQTGAALQESMRPQAPPPRPQPARRNFDPPQAISDEAVRRMQNQPHPASPQVRRTGNNVGYTVDHDHHLLAWQRLGGYGDTAPPAFIYDGQVYLDPSRWPRSGK